MKECAKDAAASIFERYTKELGEPPAGITLQEFLHAYTCGQPVRHGSAAMRCSGWLAQRALLLTAELNGRYYTPEEVRALFFELTGKPLDETFRIFPPFFTDCGVNISVGKHVFINSGCTFQDQGGITIGDGALIGHHAMLATLNHSMDPKERHDVTGMPIHIGKNVWLGANVTVLPGVTIGDNAVIAAGAVVTKDVPANTVAAGVPAKAIRTLPAI